jgi:hypothetical protein
LWQDKGMPFSELLQSELGSGGGVARLRVDDVARKVTTRRPGDLQLHPDFIYPELRQHYDGFRRRLESTWGLH